MQFELRLRVLRVEMFWHERVVSTLYKIYRLAVTAKMLVCLSLAFVLDSEKVKTAAVAERCDCETRLRARPQRWCARALARPLM